MGLQLYVSNDLKALSKKLCDTVHNATAPVFQPLVIVTQTDGMSAWLTQEIARLEGIAANIIFKKPGDIIQQVYWLLGGTSENIIQRQNLDWIIYKVLSTTNFQRLFEHIAAYYNQDATTMDARKISLAGRLADLFDQYQIYRSYVIKKWNENDWKEEQSKFQWQAYIWQEIKNNQQNAIKDMTDISAYIVEALKMPEKVKRLQHKMPVIHLFGLSIVTQYHLHLFYELAKHIDLHFYLLNPAPDVYWIEDKSEKTLVKMKLKSQDNREYVEGNSLLTNWGKVLQDTFSMLYQNESFINQQEEVTVKEPERKSLLSKIQNDIFNNNVATIDIYPDDLKDESICISSNYSIPREVEALYNYIAAIFHQKKIEGVRARDVLVMVNNIEEYAPFIRAIFKNAPIKFPFHIADEPITQGDTPISSLMALLEINDQNFTAENVLQLLEKQHIRDRFGIYDINHIRKCVHAANIRFGIHNDRDDDSYLVSWQYGLQRIMYGVCISGDARYQPLDDPAFYCIDNTEGNEAMQQVLLFSDFVTMLINSVELRSRNRNMKEWVQYIDGLMDDFIFYKEEEQERYINVLNKKLEQYERAAESVHLEISYDIFSKHLIDNLQQEQQSRLFTGSGITFCSQIPMRSVPFKIVAMLGLGVNEFPRKEIKTDFDLLQQKRHLGDRSVKDNDKHLFLETLLSASHLLYLSYVGRSVKDNSVKQPSVLISELLDYIQKGVKSFTNENGLLKIDVREYIVVQHPLHNFSEKNNTIDDKNINYLLQASHPVLLADSSFEEMITVKMSTITVRDIVSFCTTSIKYYYQKVLNIYLEEEEILLPETELFEVDSLSAYQLQYSLINCFLENEDVAETVDRLKLKGYLPLKNIAIAASDEAVERAANIARQIRIVSPTAEMKTIHIELLLNNIVISGSIDNVFNNAYMFLNLSNNTDKNKMEAYLKYLIAKASGTIQDAYYITSDGIVKAKNLSIEESKIELSTIVSKMNNAGEHLVVFSKEILLSLKEMEQLDDSILYDKIEKRIVGFKPTVYDAYTIDAYKKGLLKIPNLAMQYECMYENIYLKSLYIFSND